MSQQQYRSAVQNECDIDWRCTLCSLSLHAPIAESTAVEMMSFVQLSPPGSWVSEAASGPEAASHSEAGPGPDPAPDPEPEFGSFEIPPSMDEDSMENAILPNNIVPDDQPQPVEFEMIESSTQRGKQKLVNTSLCPIKLWFDLNLLSEPSWFLTRRCSHYGLRNSG